MDRRSFIKSIAVATTAPLALLKAKPEVITLEAGKVYKSKVYHFESTPMVGGFTLEAFRAAVSKRIDEAKDRNYFNGH